MPELVAAKGIRVIHTVAVSRRILEKGSLAKWHNTRGSDFRLFAMTNHPRNDKLKST